MSASVAELNTAEKQTIAEKNNNVEKKSRHLHRSAVLARILVAAETVFAEAGLDGATMAEVAAAAKVPKANLHYYFSTKEGLYSTVLENILKFWLDAVDCIQPDADPQVALTSYIRAKMDLSRTRPLASKVFANEIIHGAILAKTYLNSILRRRVDEKVEVISGWIAKGLMDPVDPRHLLFLLWAMTQTYADFSSQISSVLNKENLDDEDFKAGEDLIIKMTLQGCGVKIRS